jgi:hypothetical protein
MLAFPFLFIHYSASGGLFYKAFYSRNGTLQIMH